MLYIIFIVLLALTIANFIISEFDYFNPAVIFNIMFMIFSIMCIIVDVIAGLEINNPLTAIIIIFGSILFTLINLISKKIVGKQTHDLKSINITTSKIIEIGAFLIEILVAYLMYKHVNDFARTYGVSDSFSAKLSFYDTITKFNTEYRLRMPSYVSIGNLIGRAICYIYIYIATNNFVLTKKVKPLHLAIVAVYFIGSLMSGRTEALRIITAIVMLWFYFYKKKNGWAKGRVKIAIRMLGIAIGIVVGFSLLRGVLGRTTYDPIKVVFGYMGAPLKNFDTFLTNPTKSIDNVWGAMTFTKFINWMGGKFGIDRWIYLSDQPFLYYKDFRMGNVYTTYYNFYYDFGFVGCIILISIIAGYYCYTYRRLKHKQGADGSINYRLLIYAYLFNDLIMLPFSSRFYETIVNINFIRLNIIMSVLVFFFNNLSIEGLKVKIKRHSKTRITSNHVSYKSEGIR